MTRREQAAASKSVLLQAARRCFTELGYEGTTVAEILERAGMARGALYHYFPGGKAEIFTAVFDLINEAFHRRRDALLALPSPCERLRAGAAVFLDLCTEEGFARIALSDAPRVVPGQGERGSTFALLQEQIDEGIAAGELRPLDREACAVTLYGTIRSAGEFVIDATDRRDAVTRAMAVVDRFIDGMSTGA